MIMILDTPYPAVQHIALDTTFTGVVHSLSTPEAPIHQFRGIKYANVPARFRQSRLFASYPSMTDCTRYGPNCPQIKFKTVEEELFGLAEDDLPRQPMKQSEFECLNLNITCPGHLAPDSRVPVMLWVHGGGDRGSGSSWVYDGGSLVRKSILIGKPVIMVTFNYRLGLFGFAASPSLRDDNKAAGDEGVGNYGLRDQRKALEWVHHFIGDFGGDPSNITIFGEASGATDIVSHLLSAANEARPLFQRAIIQSAIVDNSIPDVHGAGWHLSRIMATVGVATVEQLRHVEPEKIVVMGQGARATDDGFFFRKSWKDMLVPDDHHHHHRLDERPSSRGIIRMSKSPHPKARSQSRAPVRLVPSSNLQPIIIGDCASESLLWSLPASMWCSSGVVRRIRAVCQSLSKASTLLRAYDISPHTPHSELVERILELVNDARVAWPTECLADAAKRDGRTVWRYVFDQEGPTRGVPHHAVDLMYLFDNVPLPTSPSTNDFPAETFYDGPFDGFDSDSDDSALSSIGREAAESVDSDEDWSVATVDTWTYTRVRDAIQERWIAFAQGEAPWSRDKVYVFGPEGETGERSSHIFEGRRRRGVWKEAFEQLGSHLVQKVGIELSNGPSLGSKNMF